MAAGRVLERRRGRHRAGIAFLALIAVLLGGCAGGNPLQTAIAMSGRLAEDGFRDTNVNLNSTNGRDIVVVSASGHDSLSGGPAFIRAGELVWTQLPLRFDEMRIEIGNDATEASRQQLETSFGPRDPAMDEQTIGGAIGGAFATIGIIALVVILVVITAAVLLTLWLVRRSGRRRAAAPPWPPGPPYGGPPPWQPGPPPGYGPPPAGPAGPPPR
ncbi:hypothetical protein K1T35_18135 [Pseudonocardia sp. DSM 110487]|uniref:hypothetical protein n=1 Tax=Pseudonocardia sp. DSM 110487 TaxID=2865833 RepID=UPI001C69F450|nr:hypothetical protein [Pseudonocardia sp. DSM 110487]QYN38950.1 hypothetical protein K1T35_18135 [Pseudonocardia sp. DSM 110487]